MTVAFEFDDFNPRNSNFGVLENIKDHYPEFKVTMFTTPWDITTGQHLAITERDFGPWVNAVKKASDWLEIAVHGLTHLPMEFSELNYKAAKERIMVAENMFQNCGIKYTKIFKAPYWALSKEGKQAAEDLGFHVVEDGYFNWNLAEPMPESPEGIVIAHGHVQNTMGNGILESLGRIMKMPTDTKFKFLSEVIL